MGKDGNLKKDKKKKKEPPPRFRNRRCQTEPIIFDTRGTRASDELIAQNELITSPAISPPRDPVVFEYAYGRLGRFVPNELGFTPVEDPENNRYSRSTSPMRTGVNVGTSTTQSRAVGAPRQRFRRLHRLRHLIDGQIRQERAEIRELQVNLERLETVMLRGEDGSQRLASFTVTEELSHLINQVETTQPLPAPRLELPVEDGLPACRDDIEVSYGVYENWFHYGH